MTEKIILFDAECSLCHWSVSFIQKRDHKNLFSYVSLKNRKADDLLRYARINVAGLDSVIYLENDMAFVKSEAFFRIANVMGGSYKLVNIFRILPLKFTDGIYNFIARNRLRWFGKRVQCNCSVSNRGSNQN